MNTSLREVVGIWRIKSAGKRKQGDSSGTTSKSSSTPPVPLANASNNSTLRKERDEEGK